jgi:hypothetical protein
LNTPCNLSPTVVGNLNARRTGRFVFSAPLSGRSNLVGDVCVCEVISLLFTEKLEEKRLDYSRIRDARGLYI